MDGIVFVADLLQNIANFLLDCTSVIYIASGIGSLKRKQMKPRNPYAVFARFRKAGFHKKTTKALRKQLKQQLFDERDER